MDYKLEEEVFCLNYELQTLSHLLLNYEMERWTPGFSHNYTEIMHRERYDWVKQYVKGLSVLDLACGVGFGSKILAEEGCACEVIAGDIDKEALRYAKTRYPSKNVNHHEINAENIKLEKPVDIIVSFETIEHLRNPISFLESARNSLVAGGKLIVSTPISKFEHDANPGNPHHEQEWGYNSFKKLLETSFLITGEFLQISDLYAKRSLFNPFEKMPVLIPPTGKVVDLKNSGKLLDSDGHLNQQIFNKYFGGFQIYICKVK